MLALVAGAALAGCTDTDPGQAIPANGSGNAAPPGGGAPTSIAVPPRPSELSLTGVDACKLFTAAQLDELKVNRTRGRSSASEIYRGAPECVLNVNAKEPFYDYTASLITTEGVEPWLSGKRNVDAKLVSIEGFPAASFVIGGDSDANFRCTTSVGVAGGQQLMIAIDPHTKKAFSGEQLCQMSQQAATLAMQTLKTLK
ncbi:hypothetical protein JOF56_002448 [Kibdelosporangium banguiense]|uniref:DUF3558 domain-containing protein n=1 Tax=Kibdelosporangium banguiense TaxID=1365924 RepID=A0ABS4TCB3_9PSEU|nr:DUF3558 domain-containing protein [Kibdelosporangium banguiense]MBP2322063.1 hypothetical protein [Kibdelosporangium banguiense]